MHMSGNTLGHRHAVPVATAALPPAPPVRHLPASRAAAATAVSGNELPPAPPVRHLPASVRVAVSLLGTAYIFSHDTGRGA